jgi:hypothetical protein
MGQEPRETVLDHRLSGKSGIDRQGRDVRDGCRSEPSPPLNTIRGLVEKYGPREPSRNESCRFLKGASRHGYRLLSLCHLSIRIPWHDNGWDGTVCKAPSQNGACLKLDRIAISRKHRHEAPRLTVKRKS